MVEVENGRGGEWSRWRMVEVENGRGGEWSRWKIVEVEFGILEIKKLFLYTTKSRRIPLFSDSI